MHTFLTRIKLAKIQLIPELLCFTGGNDDFLFPCQGRGEKEQFIAQIGDEKYTIQRSKGLGENEPDMMNFTTMNPKTRRLIKVMPDDAAQTAAIFDILIGNNLQARKEYIVEHGSEYIDQLDVS